MRSRYERWLSGEGLSELERFKEEGMSDEEIAERVGISAKRLCEWKEKFPSVRKALCGDEDDEASRREKIAEQALLKVAAGYRYHEITYQRNSDTGEMEAVKSVEKECSPNTTALFFLLRNLRPDKWSDKPEIKDEKQGGVVVLPLVSIAGEQTDECSDDNENER